MKTLHSFVLLSLVTTTGLRVQAADPEGPVTPPADYLEPPPISTPKSDAVRAAHGEATAASPRIRKIKTTLYPLSEKAFSEQFGGAGPVVLPPHERVRIFDPSIRIPSVLEEALPTTTVFFDPLFEAARRKATEGWITGPGPFAMVNAAEEAAAGFPGEVIEEVIVPVPSEIFSVMDKLGRPDWRAELRRSKTPTFSNRVDVALLLGSVVAEGFVAVQAEDQEAVERIGKDVLRLSEALGLKETVLPHTNSILEASKKSHWEIVRVELDKTQKTVRDTMEQRRDAELGQCVSLGGWLRGTDAVTSLIAKNYTSDAAELLNQPDIIRHFQKELKKLATRNGKLKAMLDGLAVIAEVIGAGDEPPNAAGVQTIHDTSVRLVKSITTSASSAQ